MSRPDPIQYAERLYSAIRAANFSTLSFLSFGNAVKDGVPFRNMPRIAAEPFMRVVGEMLDLEEKESNEEAIVDVETLKGTIPDQSADQLPATVPAPCERVLGSALTEKKSDSLPARVGQPPAERRRRASRH